MSNYISDSDQIESIATQLAEQCKLYEEAQKALTDEMKKPTFTGAGGTAWETVTSTAETELPKFVDDLNKLVGVINDSAAKNREFDTSVETEINGLF